MKKTKIKEEEAPKGPCSANLLKTFLRYFKPHWKLFVLDVSCALLISLIDLAYPMITRKCMYDLLPDRSYGIFFAVIGALVAAYVLRSVMQYVVAYWGHTFGIRVEADIRSDLYRHLQDMSYSFFDKNRTGQLMSRMTSDLFDVTELAHHGPEDLIISLITLFGALIIMFTLEWRLALIISLILPVFALVVSKQRKAMSESSVAVKVKIADINTRIESGLSGMRTSKAFANRDLEIEHFEGANMEFRTAKRAFHKAMGTFSATMEFFLCILSVAVIGFGGLLVMQDRINYIDLITFSLYITAFTSPMRRIAGFSEMFASGFAGLSRFAAIMDTEPAVQDAADAVEMKAAEGDITLDHVSFTYNEPAEVLHDVSLHITPGETVAIVGPSGGGKTTLCQLLPRFYDVSDGAILVDGIDIRKVTQASLRRNIGIVQQDVFLFADTILENIRYGRPDATDDEVIAAAKQAEIYDDIMAMPDGFDTYVGERGMLLSGGQKQRVSIARIFLKNPAILILDEATSALDTVTESRIQRAFDLLAEGRTTLIIAHRLSTIRSAARILVVKDGVIAESGSHDALMKENGLYADLYRTQTELHFAEMS